MLNLSGSPQNRYSQLLPPISSLQILIHCKVRSHAHKDNRNIVYPVHNLGAATQLKHIDRDLRYVVTQRIQQEFSLEDHGDDSSECLLCETSDPRLNTIFDYFIKGQCLFYISELGIAFVKEYGKEEWKAVV